MRAGLRANVAPFRIYLVRMHERRMSRCVCVQCTSGLVTSPEALGFSKIARRSDADKEWTGEGDGRGGGRGDGRTRNGRAGGEGRGGGGTGGEEGGRGLAPAGSEGLRTAVGSRAGKVAGG